MVIKTHVGISTNDNIPGNEIWVRYVIKQKTGMDNVTYMVIKGHFNKRVSMEVQLGSEIVNLRAEINHRKFRDGLEQFGDAEGVERERECIFLEVMVEEEGVLQCGVAKELMEELVGEMGLWVWNEGETGESIVFKLSSSSIENYISLENEIKNSLHHNMKNIEVEEERNSLLLGSLQFLMKHVKKIESTATTAVH
ncbi:hypothetical protein VNO78_09765 [Psophocarpus tetragonolobus]|uniref:Uncharacterized protein n=1 Tax=Psophocarpus tetragonolobus TaxID=3891 RepID=A0AAN9SWJ5_PSOTE